MFVKYISWSVKRCQQKTMYYSRFPNASRWQADRAQSVDIENGISRSRLIQGRHTKLDKSKSTYLTYLLQSCCLVPPKSAPISRKMRLTRLIIFMYVDLSHRRLDSETDCSMKPAILK